MHELFYIFVFGSLGIGSRYGIDKFLVGFDFPLSTFLINILGSFLAGLIYTLGTKGLLNPQLQTGLLVGFCGGFTTFSAYALQSFNLYQSDKSTLSLIYLFASPVLGFFSVFLAVVLTQKWLGA